MNKAILTGRFTDEPKVSDTNGGKKFVRFTLAVDRVKEGADFISCVAWEKNAEFVQKYCHKGIKYLVEGHIQTGSYEGKNGKVYTTDIVCEHVEFLEKKKASDGSEGQPTENPGDDWMNIPDGVQEELPFT